MKSSRKLVLAVFVALLVSTALVAQDLPLRNWTVPPFDASMFIKPSGPSIRPMTHGQGNTPAVFVPFGPCRLTDSRVSSGGPGPIAGGGSRAYDFVPTGCQVPFLEPIQDVSSPIIAWSLNFTVLNTAGAGFLYAWPTGGTPPPVSILNYTGAAGEIRNNAAIVPVDPATGSFTVGTGGAATDVIIDTNGVFLAVLEPDTTFKITSNTAAAAIWGSNTSVGIGVRGESTNGAGVLAQSGTSDALVAVGGQDGGYLQGARNGVTGFSTSVSGVTWGVSGSNSSATDGAAGVLGSAGGSGNTFGGKFTTSSTSFNAAGVKGVSGYGDPLGDTVDCLPCYTSGVRGVDSGAGTKNSYGVLGISKSIGVGGLLLDPTDAGILIDTDAEGYLGYRSTDTVFYGVLSLAGTGATGIKSFIEPHKSDPSKVIRYVSLEGNEAGTYFRGKGRFERGVAVIAVPEDFRLVTDEEGLSIQVTPIGEMATVAVASIGLDRIVVRGSRNVEFFYTVNGVRSTFKAHKAIDEGNEFIPRSAEATMPRWLSEGQKSLLIQNGTYKPDGTVNMETATRLGWDKIWEKRNPPAPAPNPE